MTENYEERERIVQTVEDAEDRSGGNPAYVADTVISHL